MSALARADAAPVILASGSPTRAALLQAAGVPFTAIPAYVDEAALRDALRAEGVPLAEAAVALAEMKAGHVAARAPDEAIVLGADQLLECRRRLAGEARCTATAPCCSCGGCAADRTGW